MFPFCSELEAAGDITPFFCLFSVSKGVKLAEAEPGAAEELIGYLEAAVTDNLEQKGISR